MRIVAALALLACAACAACGAPDPTVPGPGDAQAAADSNLDPPAAGQVSAFILPRLPASTP